MKNLFMHPTEPFAHLSFKILSLTSFLILGLCWLQSMIIDPRHVIGHLVTLLLVPWAISLFGTIGQTTFKTYRLLRHNS